MNVPATVSALLQISGVTLCTTPNTIGPPHNEALREELRDRWEDIFPSRPQGQPCVVVAVNESERRVVAVPGDGFDLLFEQLDKFQTEQVELIARLPEALWTHLRRMYREGRFEISDFSKNWTTRGSVTAQLKRKSPGSQSFDVI